MKLGVERTCRTDKENTLLQGKPVTENARQSEGYWKKPYIRPPACIMKQIQRTYAWKYRSEFVRICAGHLTNKILTMRWLCIWAQRTKENKAGRPFMDGKIAPIKKHSVSRLLPRMKVCYPNQACSAGRDQTPFIMTRKKRNREKRNGSWKR